MQISSASLLAAQQARAQAAPQRIVPKASADELFEPLFGKVDEKPAATTSVPSDRKSAAAFARLGSQIDIRV